MALIAKEKWTIELVQEGIYLARCVSIIDLGTQLKNYKDQEKMVHEVRFEFELPTVKYTYEDKETKKEVETTKVMWNNFTISLSPKANMRKFLESWRGKKFTKEELEGFDLSKILWKVCQLQIIHSEDGKYANIANALPLMAGVTVPETERELLTFSIDEDKKGNSTGYNEEVFEKLPNWLQEKIMESSEMKTLFWIISLDYQEKEIEKEIEVKKEINTTEVEWIFNWKEDDFE